MILDCDNRGTIVDWLLGMDWVIADLAEHQEARGVMSFSASGGGTCSSCDAVVRAARDAGIPLVAGAGNGGVNDCWQTPQSEPSTIVVGASNRYDWREFNYGECVDVFAPGKQIHPQSHVYSVPFIVAARCAQDTMYEWHSQTTTRRWGM